MRKFKIGDKVICGDGPYKGLVGKIIVDPLSTMPGLEFDVKLVDTHSCGGLGKAGYCWYAFSELLKPVVVTLENK